MAVTTRGQVTLDYSLLQTATIPGVPADDDARPCQGQHAALEQAILAYKACIEKEDDLDHALQSASRAIALVRISVTEFTQLRAKIAAQLSTRRVSLTRIAGLLGVSKSRAGQIVETGKRFLHLTR